jgi:type II secretory pathway pseudopilin PulG
LPERHELLAFVLSARMVSKVLTRGHTLPELLVGLAVGLAVMLSAVASYNISRQSWAAFEAVDALHHNARAALRNLRIQAQMAGGAQVSTTADGQQVQRTAPHDNSQPDLQGTEGTRTDSVSLGHWHSLNPYDCQGNHAGSDALVLNNYQLNSKKELTCKDLRLSGSTYQALAEGVEDLQVRYAQAGANQTIQWKTAAQVSDMRQVLAIEVCMRWVSSQPNATRNTASLGCQGETVAADGLSRRVLRRTFTLRNHVGVLP